MLRVINFGASNEILIQESELPRHSVWLLRLFRQPMTKDIDARFNLMDELDTALKALNNFNWGQAAVDPQILGEQCRYSSGEVAKVTNYSAALLQAKYCHKELATKPSEILSPNHDVPAEIFNFWTADYMKKRMNYVSNRYSTEQLIDFQVLFDLNIIEIEERLS